MKKKPYYVESAWGCGIRYATTQEAAESSFRKEVGDFGYKSVRPATARDVAWVRAMGGDTGE